MDSFQIFSSIFLAVKHYTCFISSNASTGFFTGGHGSPPSKDCPKACKLRCSPTLHKKPCMFFCNKWCAKCLCVPSGTHGHKENCPCYNYWKAKEAGRPKCKCP
ncbi:gibberellin-regulated protein 12-like [Pyrus ussuriensis x Pyrus communis]|uniref:Gibberellin-regulated protein 12-like n=1 Tax=Pyrus ussuriensis x Pyrus communis TaxID=2448454 RepID=A0A5N5H855_9ROSA|nr:gibberellin-regulated protein 12-like [Pyrus ussuriensis x Pyrus communis]